MRTNEHARLTPLVLYARKAWTKTPSTPMGRTAIASATVCTYRAFLLLQRQKKKLGQVTRERRFPAGDGGRDLAVLAHGIMINLPKCDAGVHRSIFSQAMAKESPLREGEDSPGLEQTQSEDDAEEPPQACRITRKGRRCDVGHGIRMGQYAQNYSLWLDTLWGQ